MRNNLASSPRRPTSCTPIGIPFSATNSGTEIAEGLSLEAYFALYGSRYNQVVYHESHDEAGNDRPDKGRVVRHEYPSLSAGSRPAS